MTEQLTQTLVDLERSLRDSPTLPELPADADAELRSRVYANLAIEGHERFRLAVVAIRKLHECIESRFDRLERILIGRRQ